MQFAAIFAVILYCVIFGQLQNIPAAWSEKGAI
jgi:hypothetical protein